MAKSNKEDFESGLFKVLFNSTTVKEGYVSSENLPLVYSKLLAYIKEDEDSILKAYSIIYELAKYADYIKERIKEMAIDKVSNMDVLEQGYTRGDKKITFKSSTTYDYSASSTIRQYDKKIKSIKKRMQEASSNGEGYIVDSDTGEHIPCVDIKKTTRSVVVSNIKLKGND